MKVKQQSIYLTPKIYISSTKFSFQSSNRCLKMRKKGCVVHCVKCYRNMNINVNTSASHTVHFCSLYIAICFFIGCSLDHLPLRLPNTRTKLWSKKCVFWYIGSLLIVASLLAEEAHNNLGIFCFTLSFIKLSRLFKLETNSQVTRTLSLFFCFSSERVCLWILFKAWNFFFWERKQN